LYIEIGEDGFTFRGNNRVHFSVKILPTPMVFSMGARVIFFPGWAN